MPAQDYGIIQMLILCHPVPIKALMNQREKVSTGAVDAKEFQDSLTRGNFGADILPWKKPNPFNHINIAQETILCLRMSFFAFLSISYNDSYKTAALSINPYNFQNS